MSTRGIREEVVKMIDKLGGRKFIYAILVLVMSFALVVAGKLETQAFLSFAEMVGGIYVIGNVASDLVNK